MRKRLDVRTQAHQLSVRTPDRSRSPHLGRLLRPHPVDVGVQCGLGRAFSEHRRACFFSAPHERRPLPASLPRGPLPRLRSFLSSQHLDHGAIATRPGAMATALTTLFPIFNRTLSRVPSCGRLQGHCLEVRLHRSDMLLDNHHVPGDESLGRPLTMQTTARRWSSCAATTSRPGPAGFARLGSRIQWSPVCGSSMSRRIAIRRCRRVRSGCGDKRQRALSLAQRWQSGDGNRQRPQPPSGPSSVPFHLLQPLSTDTTGSCC